MNTKTYLIAASLLFQAVMLSTATQAHCDDTLTLIHPGKPVLSIYLDKQATPPEKMAADELQFHLQKMTGKKARVRVYEDVDPTQKPAGLHIAIGHGSLTEDLKTSHLNTEQYLIDITSQRLAIVGGSDRKRGVLYGVYEVLERLGVRWYRPEPWGWHIPKTDTVSLAIGQTTSRPLSYEYRSTLGGGFRRYSTPTSQQREQANRWAVRNRLNFDVGSESKYGGRKSVSQGHVYYHLIPVEEYFDEHPEYFCFYQGRRRKHLPDTTKLRPGNPTGLQLCLSNPGLQELFASKLITQAQSIADLENTTLPVSPNDACPFCECEQCRAMDDPDDPTSMSNRVCKFTNIVALKVAQVVPRARLSLQAYSSWTKPPTVVEKMEPNILIHQCLINSWVDYTKKFDAPAPNWNLRFRDDVARWKKLGVSAVYTYEYWGSYGWLGPLPLVKTIADRSQQYRQHNIRGIYNESTPHWGPQGLELYMCAKLLWNPDLDVSGELQLYYQNYYGPAAKPMQAYHEELSAAFEQHPYPVYSGGRGMHLVFTPQLVLRLGEHMARAQKLIEGQQLYERRLKGVWAGYEFARRVCEILQEKKKTGKQVEQASFPDKYYLHSIRAEQAYDELIQWVRSVNKGDAVFDLSSKAPYFWYVGGDVLENAAMGFAGDESRLLKDF